MAQELHAPHYPWWHKTPLHFHLPSYGARYYKLPWMQWFHGHDWPSVRRGRQIYTEVFAPCHSLHFMKWRHLQEFMSTEETKALAAEYDITTGSWGYTTNGWPGSNYPSSPNIWHPGFDAWIEWSGPEGEDIVRPSELSDPLPRPYKNRAEAKFSNGGSAPPDMSKIIHGRHGGENYIFALLTAYNREVPAGVKCPRAGLFWNPYFPGGWLSMPTPLSEEMVDYDDGTAASVAQMAKDCCCFLAWTAVPWCDEQRYFSLKLWMSTAIWLPTLWYWDRCRTRIDLQSRVVSVKMGNL